jgi:hypothetical protein
MIMISVAFFILTTIQIPFERSTWVDLLVKYLVVSNLPFSEVEVPEFRNLINYTYRGEKPLEIPGAWAIKRRVLKLSEDIVSDLKSLFEVCDSQLFSKIPCSPKM